MIATEGCPEKKEVLKEETEDLEVCTLHPAPEGETSTENGGEQIPEAETPPPENQPESTAGAATAR